jgi:hypothetical protein
MNPNQAIRMLRRASMVAAVAAAMFVAGGCDMNISNPNAPDVNRAFGDPAGLAKLLGGAFRGWVETRENYNIMSLDAMANSYTASWNNAAIRLYSGVGHDCPSRCGWTNSSTATETAGGPAVESSWYGYYTALSSAIDVAKAAAAGTCWDADCSGGPGPLTQRNAAIAEMLEGMAFAGLSMQYDSAFIVDENTDLSTPDKITALSLSHRSAVRDEAITKFEDAYSKVAPLAGQPDEWSTDPTWLGVGSGDSYTATQVLQIIRTMEAEVIDMYPRNGAENAANDWASVASYASQGISSGDTLSFAFYIDNSAMNDGIDQIKQWGNDMTTERIDTRVAHMLSTNHADPWPSPDGNPYPFSGGWYGVDKRVGDGSWGPDQAAFVTGFGTVPATANAGTDFAYSSTAIFPPARGQEHQSNMAHVRYSYLAYIGDGLPDETGTGQDPEYTPQMNDLMWAEAAIHTGDLATAATHINNSRVGRGGLAALTGGESVAAMDSALDYEQVIEFMGQGSDPFFIKRRTGTAGADSSGQGVMYVWDDGLIQGTPRQMPVPAKELQILLKEIYTYGGPGKPDMSVVGNLNGSASSGSSGLVRSVSAIFNSLMAKARAEAKKRF